MAVIRQTAWPPTVRMGGRSGLVGWGGWLGQQARVTGRVCELGWVASVCKQG